MEVLVQSPGEVTSKDALMARVWSNVIVEANTLQVHISAIRKALGADRGMLKTVPGRGYRLLGRWTARQENSRAEPTGLIPMRVPAQSAQGNLPIAASDLIGRDAAVKHLQDLMSAYRVVTLTGPGGIGKTRLALEVARVLSPAFEGDAWLVELASLSDGSLIPAAIASALGLHRLGGDSSPDSVARAIGSRKLLLVIDNCEHVINAAASVAETLIRLCPAASVLTTSREAMRIDGEYTYRVPPLDFPEEDPSQTARDDILGKSAVQLFIARTPAWESGPRNRDQLSAIAAICRHLDGIPLAIEFAAARAATLSITEVLSRLDDRFGVLTSGRRTALPKHQTLRATLDWSFELLSATERLLLQRLAIFAGAFSMEAAIAVAQRGEVPPGEIAAGVANLVVKSLVTAESGGASVYFRLLETTRAYALEKLTESGELQQCARRHAEYYRSRLEAAADEREAKPAAVYLADCRRRVDEVHAALDWAFSDSGDVTIALALTIAAVPLWFELSLMVAARGHVERALPLVEAGSREEMQLLAAFAESVLFGMGIVPAGEKAWTHVLEIADHLNDREYQLRALWGLYAYRTTEAEFRPALELALRFQSIAGTGAETIEASIGDRLVGAALHFLGDQAEARRHLGRGLNREVAIPPRSHRVRFPLDQRIASRVILSRVLWLQGLPDQAMQMAKGTVEDARAVGNLMSLGYALAAAACSVAYFVGDMAVAEHSVAMLLQLSARHGFTLWHDWGRNLSGALAIRRCEGAEELQRLRGELEDLHGHQSNLFRLPFLGELAQGFGRVGMVAQGLATIDNALAQSELTDLRWCLAELLRIKGELVLLEDEDRAAPVAEELFAESLQWARRQAVLSWELRTSISLARLLRRRGRASEAHDTLASVYACFTEGFETTDLLMAKQILNESA